jgi:hypothetical protein
MDVLVSKRGDVSSIVSSRKHHSDLYATTTIGAFVAANKCAR